MSLRSHLIKRHLIDETSDVLTSSRTMKEFHEDDHVELLSDEARDYPSGLVKNHYPSDLRDTED